MRKFCKIVDDFISKDTKRNLLKKENLVIQALSSFTASILFARAFISSTSTWQYSYMAIAFFFLAIAFFTLIVTFLRNDFFTEVAEGIHKAFWPALRYASIGGLFLAWIGLVITVYGGIETAKEAKPGLASDAMMNIFILASSVWILAFCVRFIISALNQRRLS
jgi:VIT1/CCC1 family predicted Fe2+/Mn2+ transporter